MCSLYKTYRYNGPEYKTRRTVYGFATLDIDFFDHVQEKVSFGDNLQCIFIYLEYFFSIDNLNV